MDPSQEPGRLLLTVPQISEYYGLAHDLILGWIQQGKLAAQRLPDGAWGVAIDQLHRFLQEQGMLSIHERTTRLKFLVVDDEPTIRRVLLREIAAAWPDAVLEEASTGFEAGRKMMKLVPDVMVLDIALPGADGFEVLAALRAEPQLAGTIVVAITSYDLPETRQKMLHGGAHAFLGKPFDPAELVSVIADILAKRRDRDAR